MKTKAGVKAPVTIEVLIGEEVEQAFSEEGFLKDWEVLYEHCSWSTPFQGPVFVKNWYQVYHEKYLPVLVKGSRSGSLVGILPLGKSRETPRIFGAGELNAEYHGWLCHETDNQEFMTEALQAVKRFFPDCTVELRYIFSRAALSWLSPTNRWKFRCVVRGIDQPVIATDERQLEERLQTRAKRKVISRLGKQGEITFERITDFRTFAGLLDELIVQNDFRKAAMYGKMPFREDPLKKQLLQVLFNTNLLHLTVLRVDQQIIASKIITLDNDWAYLKGILTQLPQFAKYSPGLLHTLMLGKLLAREGVRYFDLTPGGDPYKDLLATNHREVYHVWFEPNLTAYLIKALSEAVKRVLRGILTSSGINVKHFKTAVLKIAAVARGDGIVGWIARIARGRRIMQPLRYKITPVPARGAVSVKKDSLEDLLAYKQEAGTRTLWEFLADAMKRLERGEQVYTVSEQGVLQACAWQGGGIAEQSEATLHSFYCNRGFRQSFPELLRAIAAKISVGPTPKEVVALVDPGDRAIISIISPPTIRQLRPLGGAPEPANDLFRAPRRRSGR